MRQPRNFFLLYSFIALFTEKPISGVSNKAKRSKSKSLLQSEEDWKMSFRESCHTVYTAP